MEEECRAPSGDPAQLLMRLSVCALPSQGCQCAPFGPEAAWIVLVCVWRSP
eukprot:CAMPEP_0171228746 /NCGR_PEP_ID=MMETSP0790-20130122/38526_1 /TAXON_ID=2925 /ORGANISM="Alexandrium catenella, Strain OF101" /LENGTH=50 /DNA_ID=CAMNT_0011694909 /DNA_START=40 /DNA_END=192 /DNA_ORIENTATION=+